MVGVAETAQSSRVYPEVLYPVSGYVEPIQWLSHLVHQQLLLLIKQSHKFDAMILLVVLNVLFQMGPLEASYMSSSEKNNFFDNMSNRYRP